ncbi:AraC-like DNA-binding protein [Okibacterium sp. HSC-33S16]|uniref:helix-turn-helix domain-containing protein n=1 Tax=Okibacterium sp. HSC-33S16 TaxID=2910965 RepID=UPI0020A02AC7|nr:helix-turn-helix domain-containing protein [Okibacterium sp. HSC-33S16]MCP2031105.1 AraC-like DNA-binding protein [Okibacterium sp. HSC-33S16]
MAELSDGRGILYPTRLPTFTRSPAPDDLSALIRWFWIPQWRLAPGRSSRQEVLPFPASNLVVESAGVALSGPTTGASHRDLQGSGWAVGALLRPAAVAVLCADPSSVANEEVPFVAPDLHQAVSAGMTSDETADLGGAIEAFADWSRAHLNPADEHGLLANAMEDLIATDPSIVRVEQVAHELSLSTRGVQRLAQRYVGVPPLAMIRRYRLQEAAKRLREDPSLTIAQVAADLGYADHAHLTSDFRRVLGFTPTSYRRHSTEER